MRLWKFLQIAGDRNDRSLGVSTFGISNHPGDISAIDLGKLVLHHDNVELDLTHCIPYSFRAVDYGNRPAPKLLEKPLHDQSRHRMILADQDVQRTERWAIPRYNLRHTP